MALKTLQVTIGASVTQFTSSQLLARHVLVQAHRDNSAACWVGDENADTSDKNGIELVPETDVQSPAVPITSGQGVVDLATLYAAGTPSDIVNVLYEEY
jgi:hypothetical protein